MPLYERLLGRTDAGVSVPGKIPIHGFTAVMHEYARGQLTGIQARAAVESMTSTVLTAGEATEASTLTATIDSQPDAVSKLARARLIDDVLMLGEHGVAGYAQPTQVKTRLGV